MRVTPQPAGDQPRLGMLEPLVGEAGQPAPGRAAAVEDLHRGVVREAPAAPRHYDGCGGTDQEESQSHLVSSHLYQTLLWPHVEESALTAIWPCSEETTFSLDTSHIL